MDGSSVIFIVMPVVIPVVLFASIAVPYRRPPLRRQALRPACGMSGQGMAAGQRACVRGS
jgi:hypothetical protein